MISLTFIFGVFFMEIFSSLIKTERIDAVLTQGEQALVNSLNHNDFTYYASKC